MFDDREYFCACTFMDNVFLIGSFHRQKCYNSLVTNSCLRFDTTQENWTDKSLIEVSGMIVARSEAASAVFQGNIVVSGGLGDRKKGWVQ